MEKLNQLKYTSASCAIEHGFCNPWMRSLTNPLFFTCDRWALRSIADSQRLQGSGETEFWNPISFLQRLQSSVADESGSKSKAIGHNQPGSHRASAARRKTIVSPVLMKRKKTMTSDCVPTTKFTSMDEDNQ